jgi:hypothetical protein
MKSSRVGRAAAQDVLKNIRQVKIWLGDRGSYPAMPWQYEAIIVRRTRTHQGARTLTMRDQLTRFEPMWTCWFTCPERA